MWEGKGQGCRHWLKGTMWIAGRDLGRNRGVGEIRKTSARGAEGQSGKEQRRKRQ